VRVAAESARASLRESAREYAELQDAKRTPEEIAKAKAAELAKNAMEFVPGRGLVPVEPPESKDEPASPRTPHANSAVAAQVELALQHTDKILDEEVRAAVSIARAMRTRAKALGEEAGCATMRARARSCACTQAWASHARVPADAHARGWLARGLGQAEGQCSRRSSSISCV
jgi:hypothetical protein